MKKLFLWILAFIITLSAAYYQRTTGPTYDKKTSVEINQNQYDLKLPRSHSNSTDCKLELNITDQSVNGKLIFKRYPSNDEWNTTDFIRKGDLLIASLPKQPAAGKLTYYILFYTEQQEVAVFKEAPVKIRFKGDVPAAILIPHIIFMFTAMLFANIAGIFAFAKISTFRLYSTITFGLLLLGGMILGPIVQLYAFGDLWTGVPFGWDLTDNKTLIGFIFWILAVVMNRKKERPVYTIVASIITLVIFSIPHSMFGSELDPNTGEIVQGMILFYF